MRLGSRTPKVESQLSLTRVSLVKAKAVAMAQASLFYRYTPLTADVSKLNTLKGSTP